MNHEYRGGDRMNAKKSEVNKKNKSLFFFLRMQYFKVL